MNRKFEPLDERRRTRVVVVTFDGISPFHLAVPCVVFGDRHPGVAPFDFRVCAVDGRLRTTVGFELSVKRGLGALRQADIVVIPSWRDPQEEPPLALTRALKAAHGRGARLVGLCLGAYPLAATGLLDGRTATTHWSVADDFAQRFPAVRVDREVLYVDEGDVVTSAGTAAGMDCCLHLLRQLGMTTMSACRSAPRPRFTDNSKPTVVRRRPSTAHTRKSKGATPGCRSPNTTQGTARWKGLMRSKATTAMRCGDMARF